MPQPGDCAAARLARSSTQLGRVQQGGPGALPVLTWGSLHGWKRGPAGEQVSPGTPGLRLQPVGELGGVVPATLLVPCSSKEHSETLWGNHGHPPRHRIPGSCARTGLPLRRHHLPGLPHQTCPSPGHGPPAPPRLPHPGHGSSGAAPALGQSCPGPQDKPRPGRGFRGAPVGTHRPLPRDTSSRHPRPR